MAFAEKRRHLSRDKYEKTTKIVLKAQDSLDRHCHTKCLRSFSAVKHPVQQETAELPSGTFLLPKTRRTSDVPQAANSRGVLQEKCVFCVCERKRGKHKTYERLCAIQTMIESVRIINHAKANSDLETSQKI